MTITATYIGSSTIQVTTSNLTTSNASNFINYIDTVTDAIIGTQPGANGTTNTTGILAGTFAAPVGGTATGTAFTNANSISNIQSSSGWSLYDCLQTGYTIIQVFRALNVDGTTYKYTILRWNLHLLEVNLTTCESWDPVAHAATNEVWTYYDCSPIGFRLDVTDMIINANPRWLMLNSFLNGEPSNWSMVVESAREDIMDTAANLLPCWGWTSSLLMNLGTASVSNATSKPLAGNDYTLWSMPRVKNGNTGINAAKGWAGDYGVAQYPNWLATSNSSFIYYLGNQGNKFWANSWNTANRIVMPIKPITDFTSTYITNYGTMFGLKILAPSGNHMNKISIPVDSNGNYTPAGTSKPHFLLNNYWGSGGGAAVDETSWFQCSQWISQSYTSSTSTRPEYMISTGTAWYMITTSGGALLKYSATLNTCTTITLSGTPTLTDLKFDGERYVYIGTTTGIRQLDIRNNDNVATELSVTGGVYCIVIMPTYVLVAPNTAVASPVLYLYNRPVGGAAPGATPIFALTTGTIGSFVAGSTTLTGVFGTETAVRIVDGCLDLDGNVWLTPTVSVLAANYKLIKVTPGGSVSSISTIGQVISQNAGLQVLDGNNMVLWHAVQATGATAYQFNPRTGPTLIGSATSGALAATLTAQVKLTAIKYDGVLTVVPKATIAGDLYVRLPLGGTNTTILATPVVTATQATYATNATANQFIFTDGGRIIGNNDNGIKVFTNIHGISVASPSTSPVTLGQMAIQA